MNGISRTRYDFAEFLLSLLGDVEITDPVTDNSILQYNATTGKWENVTQQDSGFLVNFEDDQTSGRLTASNGFSTPSNIACDNLTATLTTDASGTTAKIGWNGGLGFVGVDSPSAPAAELIRLIANGTAIQEWTRTDAGVSSSNILCPLSIDNDITISTGSIISASGAISFGDENLSTTGNLNIGTGGTVLDVDSTLETVGIGSAAISGALLTASTARSSSVNFTAISGAAIITPTAASLDIGGLAFKTSLGASALGVQSLIACNASISTSSGGTGLITEVIDYQAGQDSFLGTIKTGAYNVTDYKQISILAPSIGSNVITNHYGIKMEAITAGTNNWAIYSQGGNSAHAGNVRIGDLTAPTNTLEVNGLSRLGDGGTTTYLESDATGNTFWVGDGTGLPHGNMWNHDVPTTVTITAISTPTQVPSGFTVGQLNLTTFQNAREIVVSKAGTYDVVWDISFTAASANQEIEGSPMVNGTSVGPTAGGTAHRRISTATDTGNMGATTTLDLAANDIVSLSVTNETSTANVIVEHANMKLTMVGGT
jgi:hypothetical protein